MMIGIPALEPKLAVVPVSNEAAAVRSFYYPVWHVRIHAPATPTAATEEDP